MPQQATQIPLSIVVPCYNAEAYIARCLDSLLAQTLADIEIIVVDNGSADGTSDVLTGYADKGITVLTQAENAGPWCARWVGTDAASGTYISYVDGDDYVEPTFAEDLYTATTSADADIAICGFKRINEATAEELSCEMASARAAFTVAAEPWATIDINTAVWNKCFKRELLARIKRPETAPQNLEDVALCELAYLETTGPIVFTGTAPYNYMLHEGSFINSITLAQIESGKQALCDVKARYLERGASKEMLCALDATAFLHMGISMSYRLSCNPSIDLSAELEHTRTFLDEHFGTWRHNPYISASFAARHSTSFKMLWAGAVAFKTHLIGALLAAYRFYLKTFNTELKW